MNMDQLRTDAMLSEVLNETKSITVFLDAVFGFLRRKTDFYHVKRNNNENIGFSAGIREKIVNVCMQRYAPENQTIAMATVDTDDVPPAVQQIEVQTESTAASSKYVRKQSAKVENSNMFLAADFKNGACFSNYCWSQSIQDIELHVRVPDDVLSSKALKLDFKTDSLSISRRANANDFILHGTLSDKIKHNDVVWTMAQNKLHIHIDKAKHFWWERCFINEPGIDREKIDCAQFIDDLPESSQAAISKLQADQLRAEQSKELNENAAAMETLRNAWDAENSPFKGQQFDPRLINFS